MARPLGSVNHAKSDQRALDTLKSKSLLLTTAIVEQALNGCLQSQKLVLDKLLPSLKSESRPVRFKLDPSASLTEQANSILEACSNGVISPDVSNGLIQSLSGVMKIREIEEFETRLKELEQRLNK